MTKSKQATEQYVIDRLQELAEYSLHLQYAISAGNTETAIIINKEYTNKLNQLEQKAGEDG